MSSSMTKLLAASNLITIALGTCSWTVKDNTGAKVTLDLSSVSNQLVNYTSESNGYEEPFTYKWSVCADGTRYIYYPPICHTLYQHIATLCLSISVQVYTIHVRAATRWWYNCPRAVLMEAATLWVDGTNPFSLNMASRMEEPGSFDTKTETQTVSIRKRGPIQQGPGYPPLCAMTRWRFLRDVSVRAWILRVPIISPLQRGYVTVHPYIHLCDIYPFILLFNVWCNVG